MSYVVTEANNFCRVFKLPIEYPEGFLFSGPVPVLFELVDWFNPVYSELLVDGKYELFGDMLKTVRNQLRVFISEKLYRNPKYDYLIITDYGDAIVVPRP